MPFIPPAAPQHAADAATAALAALCEQLRGAADAARLRELAATTPVRRSVERALEDAAERFERDYAEVDEDLAAELLADEGPWADADVLRALADVAALPPSPSPARASFPGALPQRRNRERVDRAVAALLGFVADALREAPLLRELAALRAATASGAGDDARAQLAALRRQAESSGMLGAELRALLLRLLDAAGERADRRPAPAPARPVPWHNLPQRPYGHFVGRSAELAELQGLLLPHPRGRHFFITVDGIGGVGKSTLVIELAHRYCDAHPAAPADERFDAVVWVSAKRSVLSASGVRIRQPSFTNLSHLLGAIAEVLDRPDITQAPPEGRAALAHAALAAQRTLLIVDNLETVGDRELLAFLGEVRDPTKVVVTTRHRLDFASYVLRLSGMPHADALALMAAEAASKRVALSASAAEELFRRTGGVPLAIVWSIGLMSLGNTVESVVRRLGSSTSDIAFFCFSESLAYIEGRPSYRMLLALALFEASVSRELVGAVAGTGDDVVGRDDALAELMQLSLANQDGERVALLPLTRAFALGELARDPALEQALRGNWTDSLIALAQPYARPRWLRPDRQQLHQEGPHLVGMAAWAQEQNRPDLLLAILPALTHYYDLVGQWSDTLALSEVGLEHARLIGDLQSIVYIETYTLAWVLRQRGNDAEAERWIADALVVARQLGSPLWEHEVLIRYSQVLRSRSAFDEARACCAQAHTILPALSGSDRLLAEADVQYELGKLARDEGNWRRAADYFTAARELTFQLGREGDTVLELAWGVASNLGLASLHLGQLDAAAQFYQQALGAAQAIGGRGNLTTLLVRMALLEERRNNRALALEHAREALEWSRRLGMVKEHEQARSLIERLSAKDD